MSEYNGSCLIESVTYDKELPQISPLSPNHTIIIKSGR